MGPLRIVHIGHYIYTRNIGYVLQRIIYGKALSHVWISFGWSAPFIMIYISLRNCSWKIWGLDVIYSFMWLQIERFLWIEQVRTPWWMRKESSKPIIFHPLPLGMCRSRWKSLDPPPHIGKSYKHINLYMLQHISRILISYNKYSNINVITSTKNVKTFMKKHYRINIFAQCNKITLITQGWL